MTMKRKTVGEDWSSRIFQATGWLLGNIYLFLKSSRFLQLCIGDNCPRNFPCFWKACIMACVAIAKSSLDVNLTQRRKFQNFRLFLLQRWRGYGGLCLWKLGKGRSLCNEWKNHPRVYKQLQCIEATTFETVGGGGERGGEENINPSFALLAAEKEIVHFMFWSSVFQRLMSK